MNTLNSLTAINLQVLLNNISVQKFTAQDAKQ